MRPMRCHKYEPKRLTFPTWVQPKLNGIRALYQAGRFYSNDEIQWALPVLQHLAEPLSAILNSAYYPLDGELYLHGLSLQQINSAVSINQKGPGPKTHLIEYHVFDVVRFKTPFIDRYAPVQALLQSLPVEIKVRPVPVTSIETLREADTAYADYVSRGYEGVIYRLRDCPYTRPHHGADKDNRNFGILKRKDFHDDEFLIVELIEGRATDKGGKYTESLGAVLCGLPDGRTFKVGIFKDVSDEQRLLWWQQPQLIVGHRATIKYLTLSDEGIPQNATFLNLREGNL